MNMDNLCCGVFAKIRPKRIRTADPDLSTVDDYRDSIPETEASCSGTNNTRVIIHDEAATSQFQNINPTSEETTEALRPPSRNNKCSPLTTETPTLKLSEAIESMDTDNEGYACIDFNTNTTERRKRNREKHQGRQKTKIRKKRKQKAYDKDNSKSLNDSNRLRSDSMRNTIFLKHDNFWFNNDESDDSGKYEALKHAKYNKNNKNETKNDKPDIFTRKPSYCWEDAIDSLKGDTSTTDSSLCGITDEEDITSVTDTDISSSDESLKTAKAKTPVPIDRNKWAESKANFHEIVEYPRPKTPTPYQQPTIHPFQPLETEVDMMLTPVLLSPTRIITAKQFTENITDFKEDHEQLDSDLSTQEVIKQDENSLTIKQSKQLMNTENINEAKNSFVKLKHTDSARSNNSEATLPQSNSKNVSFQNIGRSMSLNIEKTSNNKKHDNVNDRKRRYSSFKRPKRVVQTLEVVPKKGILKKPEVSHMNPPYASEFIQDNSPKCSSSPDLKNEFDFDKSSYINNRPNMMEDLNKENAPVNIRNGEMISKENTQTKGKAKYEETSNDLEVNEILMKMRKIAQENMKKQSEERSLLQSPLDIVQLDDTDSDDDHNVFSNNVTKTSEEKRLPQSPLKMVHLEDTDSDDQYKDKCNDRSKRIFDENNTSSSEDSVQTVVAVGDLESKDLETYRQLVITDGRTTDEYNDHDFRIVLDYLKDSGTDSDKSFTTPDSNTANPSHLEKFETRELHMENEDRSFEKGLPFPADEASKEVITEKLETHTIDVRPNEVNREEIKHPSFSRHFQPSFAVTEQSIPQAKQTPSDIKRNRRPITPTMFTSSKPILKLDSKQRSETPTILMTYTPIEKDIPMPNIDEISKSNMTVTNSNGRNKNKAGTFNDESERVLNGMMSKADDTIVTSLTHKVDVKLQPISMLGVYEHSIDTIGENNEQNAENKYGVAFDQSVGNNVAGDEKVRDHFPNDATSQSFTNARANVNVLQSKSNSYHPTNKVSDNNTHFTDNTTKGDNEDMANNTNGYDIKTKQNTINIEEHGVKRNTRIRSIPKQLPSLGKSQKISRAKSMNSPDRANLSWQPRPKTPNILLKPMTDSNIDCNYNDMSSLNKTKERLIANKPLRAQHHFIASSYPSFSEMPKTSKLPTFSKSFSVNDKTEETAHDDLNQHRRLTMNSNDKHSTGPKNFKEDRSMTPTVDNWFRVNVAVPHQNKRECNANKYNPSKQQSETSNESEEDAVNERLKRPELAKQSRENDGQSFFENVIKQSSKIDITCAQHESEPNTNQHDPQLVNLNNRSLKESASPRMRKDSVLGAQSKLSLSIINEKDAEFSNLDSRSKHRTIMRPERPKSAMSRRLMTSQRSDQVERPSTAMSQRYESNENASPVPTTDNGEHFNLNEGHSKMKGRKKQVHEIIIPNNTTTANGKGNIQSKRPKSAMSKRSTEPQSSEDTIIQSKMDTRNAERLNKKTVKKEGHQQLTLVGRETGGSENEFERNKTNKNKSQLKPLLKTARPNSAMSKPKVGKNDQHLRPNTAMSSQYNDIPGDPTAFQNVDSFAHAYVNKLQSTIKPNIFSSKDQRHSFLSVNATTNFVPENKPSVQKEADKETYIEEPDVTELAMPKRRSRNRKADHPNKTMLKETTLTDTKIETVSNANTNIRHTRKSIKKDSYVKQPLPTTSSNRIPDNKYKPNEHEEDIYINKQERPKSAMSKRMKKSQQKDQPERPKTAMSNAEKTRLNDTVTLDLEDDVYGRSYAAAYRSTPMSKIREKYKNRKKHSRTAENCKGEQREHNIAEAIVGKQNISDDTKSPYLNIETIHGEEIENIKTKQSNLVDVDLEEVTISPRVDRFGILDRLKPIESVKSTQHNTSNNETPTDEINTNFRRPKSAKTKVRKTQIKTSDNLYSSNKSSAIPMENTDIPIRPRSADINVRSHHLSQIQPKSAKIYQNNIPTDLFTYFRNTSLDDNKLSEIETPFQSALHVSKSNSEDVAVKSSRTKRPKSASLKNRTFVDSWDSDYDETIHNATRNATEQSFRHMPFNTMPRSVNNNGTEILRRGRPKSAMSKRRNINSTSNTLERNNTFAHGTTRNKDIYKSEKVDNYSVYEQQKLLMSKQRERTSKVKNPITITVNEKWKPSPDAHDRSYKYKGSKESERRKTISALHFSRGMMSPVWNSHSDKTDDKRRISRSQTPGPRLRDFRVE